jgi:hypothetical protein
MNLTIMGSTLETILIEIDHRIPSCLTIVERMVAAGWRYSVDQLRTNRKVIFTAEQIERIRARGEGGFNYIFFRDDRYATLFREFLKEFVSSLTKK